MTNGYMYDIDRPDIHVPAHIRPTPLGYTCSCGATLDTPISAHSGKRPTGMYWLEMHKRCATKETPAMAIGIAYERVPHIQPYRDPNGARGHQCICHSTISDGAQNIGAWLEAHKKCGQAKTDHCEHKSTYATGHCVLCGKDTRPTCEHAFGSTWSNHMAYCTKCGTSMKDAAAQRAPAKPKVGPWSSDHQTHYRESLSFDELMACAVVPRGEGWEATHWPPGELMAKSDATRSFDSLDAAKAWLDSAIVAAGYDVPDPVTVPTPPSVPMPAVKYELTYCSGDIARPTGGVFKRGDPVRIDIGRDVVSYLHKRTNAGKQLCAMWNDKYVYLTAYDREVTCPDCRRVMKDVEVPDSKTAVKHAPQHVHGIQLPVDDPNGLDVCEEL